MQPASAAEQFAVNGQVVTIDSYGFGNVNDTYLAVFRTTFSEERIVVQKINRHVFSHPEWIMANLRVVTDHVHHKLEKEANEADRIWQLPRVIPCRDGKDYFIDDEGEYWRAITLIASAKSYNTALNAEHAYEAGTALGHFHRMISDIEPSKLHDTLPGFHQTPRYLAHYEEVLPSARAGKLMAGSVEARRLGKFIDERRESIDVLERAAAAGEIVRRPIHGDPKMANVMIDDLTGKATSIIDLDTVKPGLVQYDYGDAMRSVCNPAGEETTSLNDVFFDTEMFEVALRGYMIHAGQFLSAADVHYLYEAIWLISFELGLRFFQDYLAGNVYFKARYEEHNLNRARVQFRLCESIERREKKIRDILRTQCESNGIRHS